MKEIEKFGFRELEDKLQDCEKIGEWEAFEIYRTIHKQCVYLYKIFIRMDDQEIKNERIVLKEFKDSYDVLNIGEKVTMDKRYGFLIDDKQYESMAVMIRENSEKLEEYGAEFAKLHVKMHTLKTDLDLPNFIEYLPYALESLQVVTEFKEQLIALHATIESELVVCHNDFVPYHVLKSGEESFVIEWSNIGFADPMADVAKTILRLCSNYVPGIGPYLVGKKAKKSFVQSYLKEYKKARDIDEERLNKWIAIFCAIEFDAEMQAQGMSPDIKLLYDFVDKYFEGEEVDYFDYLVYDH